MEKSEQRGPDGGAGRGLVFITGAKLWFMVAAYVIQFALPRVLGQAKFGVWTLVSAFINPINNVMVTATIQNVSKFCSVAPERVGAITRAALRMQLLLGGLLTVLFVLVGAPLIAFIEHDNALQTPLRVAGGIIVAYSLYAAFVGVANGTRSFHKQALLDSSFSTLRCILVVGLGIVFGSATGSVAGFLLAALLILVVASQVVGFGTVVSAESPFPKSELWQFFAGVAGYLLIVNLLMFVDDMLLKRLVQEAAMAAHAADPKDLADRAVGAYGAVQNIARIPFQLIMAATFVIFPLVSKSTFDADTERTKRYVAATMRYSLLVSMGMATVFGARPMAIMRFFYKAEYAVSWPVVILLGGYVCYALFTIAGTIINAAGRTRAATQIGLATISVCVLGTYGAIKWALLDGGLSGPRVLAAAATGTSTAMLVGLLLAGAYLRKHFGAFIPLLSVGRVALSTAAGLAVGHFWPEQGLLGSKLIGTAISSLCVGVVFVFVAVISGELRIGELKKLRS